MPFKRMKMNANVPLKSLTLANTNFWSSSLWAPKQKRTPHLQTFSKSFHCVFCWFALNLPKSNQIAAIFFFLGQHIKYTRNKEEKTITTTTKRDPLFTCADSFNIRSNWRVHQLGYKLNMCTTFLHLIWHHMRVNRPIK